MTDGDYGRGAVAHRDRKKLHVITPNMQLTRVDPVGDDFVNGHLLAGLQNDTTTFREGLSIAVREAQARGGKDAKVKISYTEGHVPGLDFTRIHPEHIAVIDFAGTNMLNPAVPDDQFAVLLHQQGAKFDSYELPDRTMRIYPYEGIAANEPEKPAPTEPPPPNAMQTAAPVDALADPDKEKAAKRAKAMADAAAVNAYKKGLGSRSRYR